MPAYYNSIIEGVSTVMISYSSWNGIKMHANRELITGFLKDTLRFRVNPRSITIAAACSFILGVLTLVFSTIISGICHLRLAGS